MSSNRLMKVTKWFVFSIIFLVSALVIALGFAAPESVKALSDFNINQSLFFIAFRFSLYLSLYFNWERVVLYFRKDIPQQKIMQSRKFIVWVIAVYEVFVGFNIFKLIGV